VNTRRCSHNLRAAPSDRRSKSYLRAWCAIPLACPLTGRFCRDACRPGNHHTQGAISHGGRSEQACRAGSRRYAGKRVFRDARPGKRGPGTSITATIRTVTTASAAAGDPGVRSTCGRLGWSARQGITGQYRQTGCSRACKRKISTWLLKHITNTRATAAGHILPAVLTSFIGERIRGTQCLGSCYCLTAAPFFSTALFVPANSDDLPCSHQCFNTPNPLTYSQLF